jgi:hypothetical protein
MAGIFHRAPISSLLSGLELNRITHSPRFFPVVVCLAVGMFSYPSLAVTPESPEVRELIEKGLGYLEKKTDSRLGGRCLIALAFFKNGASVDHPRIVEAVKACQGNVSSIPDSEFVYSNGLAIILSAN